MPSLWHRILRTFFGATPIRRETSDGYPETYEDRLLPRRPDAVPAHRPRVFDPALRHFPNGFRRGDPTFPDRPDLDRRWRTCRRHAIDHVVRLIAGEPKASNHLVFRGSLVLRAWLGPDVAREPGDIDCVVTPVTLGPDDGPVRLMLDALRDRVRAKPEAPGGILLLPDAARMDDIWTYDRAPGRRIVLPWQPTHPDDADLPGGVVQIDLVFCEDLPVPAVMTPIPHLDGPPSVVRTASRELSLAWKLLWLQTDANPQAKDLYDATILAETSPPLPLDLLQRVLSPSPGTPLRHPLTPTFPLGWQIDDWPEFQRQYPRAAGTAIDWQQRLTAALAPVFAV